MKHDSRGDEILQEIQDCLTEAVDDSSSSVELRFDLAKTVGS